MDRQQHHFYDVIVYKPDKPKGALQPHAENEHPNKKNVKELF